MVFEDEYAKTYDTLYRDKDYEHECTHLEAIFARYNCQPKTILDLGCGTGSHALILAKRGYKVTGVDRSAAMLAIARRKAAAQKLEVEFIKGDITSISGETKFDAVISMFAVMGYQTSNASFSAACRSAKSSLRSGGIFIFDCWHGNAVLTDKPQPRLKETLGENGKIFRFAQPQIDFINQIVTVQFKVWRTTGSHFTETTETHRMRYLFPQEINFFLENAGFSSVDLYPFLSLTPPVSEKDWNMLVVGR